VGQRLGGEWQARIQRAPLAVVVSRRPEPPRRVAFADVAELIRRNGVMAVFPSRADFEAEATSWRIRRDNGTRWIELNEDELHQREPALDRFAKTIARWPEVLECYLMTGPRDYWLRVVVPDLAAYERFLKQKLTRLEGVASIESSFALEQVKYTNVLPVM